MDFEGSDCKARRAGGHDRGLGLGGVLRFAATLDQPVEGRLIRQGDLLMLDGEENRMKQWTVLLFSNGFYTVPRGGGDLQSFAWSPFSEVREVSPCAEDPSSPFAQLPAFTLYLFSQNLGFVFAAWGDGSAAERRRWVAAMSDAVQSFTRSLFPCCQLATEPLPCVPSTATRILAGYLLRDEGEGIVAVPYCELHAHSRGAALFAMYDSGCCERLHGSIAITAATPVLDRERTQSGCFSLDGLHLCARSFQEKHLWLRALRNVKVKLLNDAPEPSEEDLQHWRTSVQERAAAVAAEEALEGTRSSAATDAPAAPSTTAGHLAGRRPTTPAGSGRSLGRRLVISVPRPPSSPQEGGACSSAAGCGCAGGTAVHASDAEHAGGRAQVSPRRLPRLLARSSSTPQDATRRPTIGGLPFPVDAGKDAAGAQVDLVPGHSQVPSAAFLPASGRSGSPCTYALAGMPAGREGAGRPDVACPLAPTGEDPITFEALQELGALAPGSFAAARRQDGLRDVCTASVVRAI